MNKVSQGLQILLKYDPKGSIAAEHDTIFASGPSPEEASSEDVTRLEELGWHWDRSVDSWIKFV